ncbi:CoA ester lyase [uncultured Sphingomonas sp.]|uniref:HpcH/HpaI aldolase/citrate lyase family protein n=1 Tax=uncultured Sphingomonas sp. TaxID=158754 RepID=UPI00260718F8|nr:CoA ester lyase [uncultured Sphingomonas sp.]
MNASAHQDENAARLQSLLFVPGSRPDRFAKALASGADIVCIDLEDAVPAEGKDAARAAAIAAVAADRTGRLALRINGVATRAGLADLLALAESGTTPPLLLPKVESAAEVVIVRAALGRAGRYLVPLIETPRGLRATHAIAAADGVAAMMFGGGDLSAELGVELAWEPLAAARGQFLIGCAEAGVRTIDVPFVHLADEPGLEDETRRAKAAGFTAKAAIHPDQITTIHRVMRPTAQEIEDARGAIEAFAAAGGGAVRFKGRLLEAPVMRRYHQILTNGENQ